MTAAPSEVDFFKTSLATQLHTATREKHHALNRQITSRLPACLPPEAQDPMLYAMGMTVFGQIYFAMERAWEATMSKEKTDDQIYNVYKELLCPKLLRTSKLQQDLQELHKRLGSQASKQLNNLSLESQIFRDEIDNLLSAQPHALLAYAWAMYHALFNGGRWIRSQLRNSGNEFWHGTPFPLSFWDFEGVEDGEDIKIDFKARFAKSSSLLDDQQRAEVIAHSTRLFDLCGDMVVFLDTKTRPSSSIALSRLYNNQLLRIQPFLLLLSIGATTLLLRFWPYLVLACRSWKSPISVPSALNDGVVR